MILDSVNFHHRPPYYFIHVFEDYRFVAIKELRTRFAVVVGTELESLEEHLQTTVLSYEYELPYCFGYYVLLYHLLQYGVPFENFPGEQVFFYKKAMDILGDFEVEVKEDLLNNLFTDRDCEDFFEELSNNDEVSEYEDDPVPKLEPYPVP